MNPSTPASERIEKTVVPLRSRATAEITAAAVDLNDLNSPHTLAVLSVPPGARVLDVGCGPGIVARALGDRGCKVWGIEIDPRKAALARHHCIEVIEADIESAVLPSVLGGLSFDVVMCLDVLEHLREPASVLAHLTTLLAPNGRILISVPNVTHGALRLELLKGKFGYRNSGLLDRGHLRFFDADAVNAMIGQAGLRAETTLRVVKRLDQTEFDVDVDSIPSAIRGALENDADALTYQFFVIARPAAHDSGAEGGGSSLLERLRARTDQFSAELEKAGAYARHLEAELSAKDVHLSQVVAGSHQLDEMARELEKAGAYARHLEAELAAKAADHLETVRARIAANDQLTAALEAAAAEARRLEAESVTHQARVSELEQAAGQLRQELEASGRRLAESEQLGATLTKITEDHASYVRHLERELQKRSGDIAIRDDEMSVLRAHIEKTERAIAHGDAEAQTLRRALGDMESALGERTEDIAVRDEIIRGLHVDIETTERTLNGSEEDRQAARSALADSRALAAHLSWVAQHPRHRLADIVANALVLRAPRLHRILRPLVLAMITRWSSPAPPR